MPELPEVETIRRGLARRIIGKKIVGVEARDKKVAKDKNLASVLRGAKVAAVERRGKLLAFRLSSGAYLLAHLKMTGQLIYLSFPRPPKADPPLAEKRESSRQLSGSPIKSGMTVTAGGHKLSEGDLRVPNKFTRAIFTFADKSRLFFNDMRRFGYLKIADKKEKDRIWQEDFGIEPLTASFKFIEFAKLFKSRKTNIKALLMNQKLIAGIGNIYADEVCFCAGALPWRRVGSLKPEEIKKLFACATRVLRTAIKNRGTTFKSFVDGEGKDGGHYRFLNVYERDGEKCRRCGGVIKKTRQGGRGTHYCPKCQK